MFIRLLLSVLVLTLVTAPPAKADTAEAVNDHLASALETLGANGGTVAVVRGGRVTHVSAAGRDGEGETMSEHTRFLLGSVSKPITATLAVKLADEGRADLDAPVVDVLPELRTIAGAETITARHLLSHTSGLSFGAEHLDRTESDRTPAGVLADLEREALHTAPGERYEYSSLGYLVLTAWLEAHLGQPLEDAFGADLGLSGRSHDPDEVPVTAGQRGPWMPPSSPEVDPAGAGYGYSAGSIITLAEFARLSLADATRLRAMTDVDPQPGETLTGLGWRVTQDDDGLRRVWHTGTVPGYFTAVHLVPDEDLAVVFAVNRSGFLDETRLYEASVGLLAVARGQQPDLPGAWPGYAVLGGILAVAAVGAALARGNGWRRWVAVGIGALLLTGPLLLTVALGVPLRYGWLWAPEVVLALVIGGLMVMAAACVPRRRRGPETEPT